MLSRKTKLIGIVSAISACFVGTGQAASSSIGTAVTEPLTVASPLFSVGNDVATDAAGNFTVMWSPFDGDSEPLLFRRYAADGTPLTGTVSLPASSKGRFGALGSDSAGDVVVVWNTSDEVNSTPVSYIYAQVFTPQGLATGDPIEVASVSFPNRKYASAGYSGVAVTMDAAGNFTVGWSGTEQFGKYFIAGDLYTRTYVKTRRYHLDGSPYGDATTVAQQTYPIVQLTSNYTIKRLRGNSAGDFAVSYQGFGNLHARFYKADGTATSSEVSPSGTALNSIPYFSCAPNDSSEFFCSWETLSKSPNKGSSDEYTAKLYLAKYSAAGVSTRGPVAEGSWFSAPNSFLVGGLKVQPTQSGDVLVVRGNPSDTSLDAVTGQAFDGNLKSLVSPFAIGSVETASGSFDAQLATAMTPSGNLLVVWGSVFARMFQGP